MDSDFSILRPAPEESGEVILVEIRKNLIHKPSKGFDCKTPSMTQPQFKDECDVNNILRNYVNTGVLTHTSANPPVFGDFSQVPTDYGEALAVIEKSREQFALLPSEVRERFDNNPHYLVSFLQDPANVDEAVKLGLMEKKASVENVEQKSDPNPA